MYSEVKNCEQGTDQKLIN